jgi:PGF-CTERM protein
VVVQAAAGQTITGSSTFAEGTEVTVEATSNDDSVSPYVLASEEPATVDEDGDWSATLDFSTEEANTGTTFDALATALDATDTVTGEIQGTPQVNALTFDDQSSSGDSVIVQNVNMSNGGFVAIHLVNDDGSFGEVIGASSYLSANTDHRVAIVLDESLEENQDLIAMPHQDTDNDQVYEFGEAEGLDAPYTDDEGNVVTATAAISGLGGGEATATATATPTATATATATATPTETDTGGDGGDGGSDGGDGGDGGDGTDTPSEDGPGFGIVVSVLALLAAALLAVRRNE